MIMEREVLCIDTSQVMFKYSFNDQARLADKSSRTLYVSSLDLFVSLPSFSDPMNKKKERLCGSTIGRDVSRWITAAGTKDGC